MYLYKYIYIIIINKLKMDTYEIPIYEKKLSDKRNLVRSEVYIDDILNSTKFYKGFNLEKKVYPNNKIYYYEGTA